MPVITTNFVKCIFLLIQQTSRPIEMADKLRENGKIYVVVAILVTILIGVFIYLISIDRKISKLEQKNNQ